MSRFAFFLTVVLSVWAGMHAYAAWRLSTIPAVTRFAPVRVLVVGAALLCLSFPLARFLEGRAPDWVALPMEYLASNWVGFLFLQVSAFLIADLVTLGGAVFAGFLTHIRLGATLVALGLGLLAMAQGHRDPVVTDYELTLERLPAGLNGTKVVAISDLHLGSILGERWLTRLVARVNDLQPEAILAVGDIVDGDFRRVRHLPDTLKRMRAPLGVWAVTGNHEFYAGARECVDFFGAAGMRVLRNEAREVAPGLVFAGVDDLTARTQFGHSDGAVRQALEGRSPGATILLSHTPWDAELAAQAGVDLMVCGHTHKGQIWPFTHLVAMRYPLVAGLYEVGPTKVLVGRGTGTWGPRMRLWERAEILRITLRSPPPTAPAE